MTSELITKLEAAEGPDRELDVELGKIGLTPDQIVDHLAFASFADPYTASVDAAMNLIDRALPEWHIHNLSEHIVRQNWTVELWWWEKRAHGMAKTPALALLCALLCALAEREGR